MLPTAGFNLTVLGRHVCSDVDNDDCDDCSSGTFDTSDDGVDGDGDGRPDETDCAPLDDTLQDEIIAYIDIDFDGVAENDTEISFCLKELPDTTMILHKSAMTGKM